MQGVHAHSGYTTTAVTQGLGNGGNQDRSQNRAKRQNYAVAPRAACIFFCVAQRALHVVRIA
eukprot:266719-Chlamydomonas_euryale.AAC.9